MQTFKIQKSQMSTDWIVMMMITHSTLSLRKADRGSAVGIGQIDGIFNGVTYLIRSQVQAQVSSHFGMGFEN